MHYLFAGGGTAGHINPAIAVAGYLKKADPDCRISFIGTKKGMESRLVPMAGYDFYTIDVAGFQRKLTVKNIFKNISAAFKAVTSSGRSRKLLKKLQPDVVIGTGGYVCGPVVMEAAKLGIKTAVHESNAFPGVTIKMLAPHVDVVMLGMKAAEERLKCKNPPIVTGNPIRSQLTALSRNEARKKLGIPDDADMVLSFGGSLGAKYINKAVVLLAKAAANSGSFYLFHGTGRSGYGEFMSDLESAGGNADDCHVNIYEYIDNMDVLMAAADIVVCRAGAMTINELEVCKKPSVLIPSPYVAENHQFHNAMALKNAGAAEIIEEKDLIGERLLYTIRSLLGDKQKLCRMSENAGREAIVDADRRIADILMNLQTK